MATNLTKGKTASEFFTGLAQASSPLPSTQFREELREKLANLHLTKLSQEGKPQSAMEKIQSFLHGRRLLLASVAAIVLVVAAVVGVSTLVNQSKLNAKLGSELAYVEGDVEYRAADGGWFKAEQSQTLSEGMQVRVLGEGRAIVNLDDGSAVRLDSDTTITLSSLSANNIVINNDKGNVYTRVVKAERAFAVVAGDARFESLGTAYKTVKTDAKLGVEVYQSKVHVKANSEVTVEEGKKYYLELKEKPEQAAKLVDLKQEELGDDFVQWNKQEDEKSEEFKDKLGVLKDVTAPKLSASSTAGTSTTGEKTTISGEVEAGAKVFINSAEIAVKSGKFGKEFILTVGENKFKIEAKDVSGNKASKEIVVTHTVQQTPPPVTVQTGISLSASKKSNGVSFSWKVNGVSISQGFKLVKATHSNPTYGQDSAVYLDGSGTRSYLLEINDGKTYYFRVCRYTGSGCDNYSNAVKVTAPSGSVAGVSVSSINLSVVSGSKVAWTVNGEASQGFKLVWSTNPNPTYPTNGGGFAEYLGAGTSYYIVPNWNGTGTHYVRVCAYNGNGGCVAYSNQVTVDIQ
jgi:hypothetical protein